MKTILLLLNLVLISATAPAQTPLVANGNFEAPVTAAWPEKDVIPTFLNGLPPLDLGVTQVFDHRPESTGSYALHVSGRDHVQDGPAQGGFVSPALKFAFMANGNGRTYSTRVWVRLAPSAAEASVRCLLRWRVTETQNGLPVNVQQIPLILAECVLTGQDGWVEMKGTATLQWDNPLAVAGIDFECEQLHRGNAFPPLATWFPSYNLDDLVMELDDDGDGLFNSEESTDHEQAALTFSDDPDSDNDRMTDDWELAQMPPLDPRDASDGMADPDGDGFTNVQEYFGATNPHLATSYPGKPSDPLATHQTRALLRYLALRPWREQVLVGQMVSDDATEYAAYVAALAAQPIWGRWPAILGLAVEKQDAPVDIVASIDHAIPFANAGGIVQIKWAMWNPWTLGNMGDQTKIDIPGLIDPEGIPTTNNTAAENQAARDVVLGWIALVASEIQRFNLATDSKPILFRPLSEMNGNWFWWGRQTRDDYLLLWNFIRDRLITHHELHNLIWVSESAQTEHVHPVPTGSAAASDYYYPGDDRVDVMCHNLYDDDWVLPFDANKVYSRYPKIYGVPQAGPGKDQPDSRDGHFDNMNYLTQIALRYPRMSFFIVWNSFSTANNSVHHKIAIIDSTNPNLLMPDSRAITRDEVRWLPPANPAAGATSSGSLAATWSDISAPAQNESAFRLEIAASEAGPWSLAADTAADATSASAAGLPAASTRWLRVRSLFSNGDDSLPTDPISATSWSLFQQWKSDTLGDFNAPDLDDDDHDGLVSLLEYGLGTDPLTDSQAQQPAHHLSTVASADYLSLTFRRRIVPGGVSYAVESTGDLLTGPWLPHPVQLGSPLDNGDGTETVTFRDIVPVHSATSRFLRLRMSTP